MIQTCYAKKGTIFEKWRKNVGDSPCFVFLIWLRKRRIVRREEHIIANHFAYVCIRSAVLYESRILVRVICWVQPKCNASPRKDVSTLVVDHFSVKSLTCEVAISISSSQNTTYSPADLSLLDC